MPSPAVTASELPLRTRGCCQPLADVLPASRAAELAGVFRALDDPHRVRMVQILGEAREPVCVCDFTATFDLSQPTVSHHLRRLRGAGLVVSQRRGAWTFHELNPEMSPIARAAVDVVRAAATA